MKKNKKEIKAFYQNKLKPHLMELESLRQEISDLILKCIFVSLLPIGFSVYLWFSLDELLLVNKKLI